MKNKKIVVTLKYYKGELNPFDGAALESALQVGGEVTAVAMAPLSAIEQLKGLTRLGVKAILISDKAYAGSDTLATSKTLAEALKRLHPDYVFCGRQSVDGDTAQVPPMLAQLLGFSFVPRVISIDGKNVCLRNGTQTSLSEKSVVTFERICSLRFPSIFSRVGEVEVWDNQTLGLPLSLCGQQGSPTRVIKSYESTVGRRTCQFIDCAQLDNVIEKALKKSNTVDCVDGGEKLDVIHYVGELEEVANRVALKAIRLDVRGKTPEEVAREIEENNIKFVLWEDSEKLKILAPKVAVLTGAGLCADCISFRIENGKWVMTRPALGGNITADIVCDKEIAFATVRTARKGVSEVIFSIGKGAVHKIDEIKKLAEKYNAEVCCSRAVVDNGYLPYTAQVGLTGRTVSPKVYVAFGISGAVQHTCAIAGAGTVIALNADKQARIFDYADYGIVAKI